MWNEIRFALRGLLRTPVYTGVAALTVAVGIAATTAVFALLNALLLQPLPVERQQELATVEVVREDGGTKPIFSWPQYGKLREHQRGLTDLAAYGFQEYGVAVPGAEPGFLTGWEVSGNYFEVLGVRPALGRFFTSAEVDGAGSAPVIVISHDFWQREFGGAADAPGRTLLVNGQPLNVIGVAPPGYQGTIPAAAAHFWVPVTLVPTLRPGTNVHGDGLSWLMLTGRLAPGTTRAQAEALLSATVRTLEGAEGERDFTRAPTQQAAAAGVTLGPLRALPAMALGPVTGFMALLLVTAGMVLVIAGVNVTGMALARATARARELALRRSLGATRVQLVRPVVIEHVLLFLMGAVGGVVLAAWVVAGVPAMLAALPMPVALEVPLDWRVLGFAVSVALAAGVLFGLAPALSATGGRLMPTIREGATSPRRSRLRGAFVVGQLAISLVLLVLGGLLGRSLQQTLATDPGFDPAGVAVAQIALRPWGYDAERAEQFFAALRQRLDARGDVAAAGASTLQPLLGFGSLMVRPEGQDAPPEGGIYYNYVDDGFLDAVRMPLLMGRAFDAADTRDAPPVVIVNDAFARRFWPGENPLGRYVYQGAAGQETAMQVVGVVATGRYQSLNEPPQPFFMRPIAQQQITSAYVFARGPAGSGAMQQALREEVRALDPTLPLNTSAMAASIGMLMLPQRIASLTIGVFGLLGLVLAGIGIYGVVAFAVAQRTREIGVRLALGAGTRQVVALFLRQGARLLAIGGAIGLLIALAAGHALGALLHGVSPRDPATMAGVVALLAAVVLLATYLPARRASRVDPMVVLRSE
jgi:predicted permease